MTEYDDPQLRIEELEDENSRLRWKLRESEQQKDFLGEKGRPIPYLFTTLSCE